MPQSRLMHHEGDGGVGPVAQELRSKKIPGPVTGSLVSGFMYALYGKSMEGTCKVA